MTESTGTDTSRATDAQLLADFAQLVGRGLSMPFSIRYDGTIVFQREQCAAVESWAAALSLPAPALRQDRLYPAEGDSAAWREYRAIGQYRGRHIDVWCSVDVPAAEVAPAPGVPVAEPLPRRVPSDVTA